MSPIKLKSNIEIPKGVRILSKLFKANGFELYLVGGAVRDHLMNKPIKDYDLATDAFPGEVQNILNQASIKNIGIGEAFGVFNAIIDGEEYEIATFRSDSDSGDGRRPDSVVFSDIKTDVYRRDLTINALFYNLSTREIVDYVGGIEDIRNGVIRTVGEPQNRFNEDRLRILRAIRFTNRTGADLDPSIDQFFRSGYTLSGISGERIRDEFIKSINSAVSTPRLMNMYDEYDMFKWILPDLFIEHNYIDTNNHIFVLGQLLRLNKIDEISKTLNKLKYGNQETKDISFLSAFYGISGDNGPLLKRMQKNTTLSNKDVMEFGLLSDIPGNLLNAFCEYELSVKGFDVMSQYNLSGVELGKKIGELELEIYQKLL